MEHVARDVAVMAVVGIATGAAGALTAGNLIRGLLFGVTPTEPGVFGAVLAAAAFAAGWLPAHRAAGVDPLIAAP